MKVHYAIKYATNFLSEIEDKDYAKWETLIILSYLLNTSPLQVYLYLDKEIPDNQFFKILSERKTGKPLPYILKEAYFWGRKFYIEEGVLIPRQDTETLISVFFDLKIEKGKILELGTGSGAISITLLLEKPGLKVFGVEKSVKAIEVSLINARKYNVIERFFLIKGDWLDPIYPEPVFKAIVSNPPYISAKEWEKLERDVRNFEPPDALIAGEKGIEYQEIMIKEADKFLCKKGFLIFEIGYNQSQKIRELLEVYKWRYKFYKDLRNYERVVVAWKENT
ncbi:peptide chain release factor N(5)-glutamine methyltransferase [Candidatus Pacearchaeota archaeon]|nr:MAG: peptide chain release factor N(5)-glutamine methyltransferase [Candidatus Pacearchaeota archaeon]